MIFGCPTFNIMCNTIPARFRLTWFRGFRREDLNVKVYDVRRTDGRTDDERQVMAKAHLAFGQARLFPTWYMHFPRKWWVKPGFTARQTSHLYDSR
jgi:hypothetical protein